MAEESNQNQNIQVNVKGDHMPVFSNSVQINVSDEEVVLQFLFVRRNTNQGTLVSEVVLTPQHAIKLQRALDDTIKKHFTKHLPE